MKEKVLISRKRLYELENIELNYKMMENAVNIAQERSEKLAKRNIELSRGVHRLSLEQKDLSNRVECISDHKAINIVQKIIWQPILVRLQMQF